MTSLPLSCSHYGIYLSFNTIQHRRYYRAAVLLLQARTSMTSLRLSCSHIIQRCYSIQRCCYYNSHTAVSFSTTRRAVIDFTAAGIRPRRHCQYTAATIRPVFGITPRCPYYRAAVLLLQTYVHDVTATGARLLRISLPVLPSIAAVGRRGHQPQTPRPDPATRTPANTAARKAGAPHSASLRLPPRTSRSSRVCQLARF
jgi:hypothetical protein